MSGAVEEAPDVLRVATHPEPTMTFRLCIINPNCDETVTDHLRTRAADVLPAGSHVEAFTCFDSPPVIETAEESAAAAVSVLRMAREAEEPDAYFIGCFGSPGLEKLRAETGLPVVGLGDAALLQASYLTRRFGLVTTLECGIAGLWDQVGGSGLAGRCVGIEAANSGLAGDGTGNDADAGSEDGLLERLERAGRRLVEQGADGLVTACATFSPEAARLSAALGVAVCDGVGLGPALARSLWATATLRPAH